MNTALDHATRRTERQRHTVLGDLCPLGDPSRASPIRRARFRSLSLLLLAALSALPAAAQVPPVWVPPAGWEILGDLPTRIGGGGRDAYAIDEAGWLWNTGPVYNGFNTYDFHRLDLAAPLPGRWLPVDRQSMILIDSPPLFFSHPDTLLTSGQGTWRTVTGPGGFERVSNANPIRFYRRVSSRDFGERIFSHDASSDGGIDIRASDNRGRTWRPLDWPGINQPNFAVLSVAAYPTEAGVWGDSTTLPLGRLIFGTTFGAVRSDDNGETAVEGGLFGQAYTLHQVSVLARPEGGLRIVAAGWSSTPCGCVDVWTSDDHGETFVRRAGLNDPMSPNSNTPVALLPQVRRSDGSLWVAGPSQATPSWQTSNAVLVLSTGILYRTSDAGLTWSQAPPPYDRIPFEAPFNNVESALMDSAGRLYPNVFEFSGDGGDGNVWAIRSVAGFPVAGEATSPSNPSSSELSVTVAPNPSSGAAVQVRVSVAAAGSLRVVVVDALGRTVAVLHDGPAVGHLSLALDTKSLASGVYVVRAESAEATSTAQMTVTR